MTIVEITCPQCWTRGALPITAVLLLVTDPELEDVHSAVSVWICQGCESLVGRPIGWVDFVRLAHAGAQLIAEELGPHPESPPPGPTLAYDDLLDLHLLLDRPDWFIELERLTLARGVLP